MTPEEQKFNSWKYARRITLVPLGDGVFGLAGPDLRLQSAGPLEELTLKIHELATELEHKPLASPPRPKAPAIDLSEIYL